MNSASQNVTAAKAGSSVENKQLILDDIRGKWGKFSEQELGALKGKDDLVAQIVAKYSLDKAQAQRDVDAMMKGRQF